MSTNEDRWRDIEADAFRVQARGAQWRIAAAGAVATAGPLAVGAIIGRPDIGLMAGLGGLNTGLALHGASLHARITRGVWVLVAATAATALASALHPLPVVSVLATFAVTSALASTRAGDPQDALAGFVVTAVFVIVNGLEGDAADALGRALQFGIGGTISLGLFLAAAEDEAEPADREPLHRSVRSVLTAPGHPVRTHSLRTGLTTALGTALYRALDLSFGYWLPLTALAVLQPDLHSSRVRALQRGVGTLIGAAIVALVASLTSNDTLLIVLTACSAYALFAVGERSYHWLVLLLTPTALLMISTLQYSGWAIAATRVANTGYGIVLALVAIELTTRLVRRHASTTTTD